MDILFHRKIERVCHALSRELRPQRGGAACCNALRAHIGDAMTAPTADAWLLKLREHGGFAEIRKTSPEAALCVVQLVEFIVRNIGPGAGRQDAVAVAVRVLEAAGHG